MSPDGEVFLNMRRIRALFIVMSVLLLLWLAFAYLVVPSVIENAYQGKSLPVFNNLIRGHATHSVDEYVRDWQQLAWRITLASSAFGILGFVIFLATNSPAFFKRFVGEATPGTLGAMRVWICAVCLIFTVLEDLPSIAWLPAEVRVPGGVMGWLYALPIGVDGLVASERGLRLFQLVTEGLLFLGMIGWGTRLVLPLAAVCFFVLGGILRDYSFNWHQGWVPLYLITILCFTPCGDGWSIDRLLKIVRGQPTPDPDRARPVYGWARYSCWVAIAVTYAETGWCKLRMGGFYWWNPDGLRATWAEDSLQPREFDWHVGLHLNSVPDSVIGAAGIFVLAFESLWILALFSKTVRMVWPPLTIIFHLGVLTLQRIFFFDLILLQLVFYDLTGIRNAITRRLEASFGLIHVLFDGQCPLCIRTVRVLRFFDLFRRLEFLDFRRLDLAEYNRRHQLALTTEDLDREMYVISRGHAYVGYYGYRLLALALPAFWLLSPLLFLPGVSWAGERVYSVIARNRLALLKCDDHCQMVPSRDGVITPGDDIRGGTYALRYACLITAFSLAMAVSFVFRIEFYPLTAWHLYAVLNTTGDIHYWKVLGHKASGQIVPVRLEDAVGALGWDGRYSAMLNQCFGGLYDSKGNLVDKNMDICKKFLSVSGVVYNKKFSGDRQISRLEVQQWSWQYLAHPYDPAQGTMLDRVIVEIEPVSAAAKKEM